MKNVHHYAQEKFEAAINMMATSPNTLQHRLRSAYTIFHSVQPEDFKDEEVRSEFEEILRRLTTRKGHPTERGSVHDPLDHMSDGDAEVLANLIYDFWIFRLRD